MAHVTQIDGAPGTGKTYTLRKKLEAEAADGLTANGFWWLNFTNSGREDVAPEILEVFGHDDEEAADRAKTLHGLALSLAIRAGVISPETVGEQIIVQGVFDEDDVDPYAEFCQRRGMTYDPDAADPRKLLSGESTTEHTGNKLFAINDYLTQTCKPPEKWRDAPTDIRIAGDRVIDLLESWDEYKRTAFDLRLFEHGDYVELAYQRHLTPAVDVLLVDEFQDLAPLEYRLYKLWRDSGVIDRLYIAGDPNQSIYSFRGGTPYYFENTDVDDHISLKESRRCPADIARIGSSILAAHKHTDPRGFTGKTPGGAVRWETLRDKYELRDAVIQATERYDADPAIFLLTRTNYQLRQLERDLRAVGVPFEVLGSRGGVWHGDLRQMLAFLNNWKSNGSAYAWSNARTVIEALPDAEDRRRTAGTRLGGIIDRSAIAPALDGFTGALDIVQHLQIKSWKRDVLANAVDAPAAMTASEVRVGTIHTAKGLEAPCIHLFTTSSDTTVKRYSRDPVQAAEEHRVYYVGATRASKELHLVSGYFDGPPAPPIQKIRRQEVLA